METEQEFKSIVTVSKTFEQEQQCQRAEEVIQSVIQARLEKDLEENNITKNPNLFIQRRLPLYLDALKRGEKTVMNKILKGQLKAESFDGLYIMEYTYEQAHPFVNEQDKIRWKISPRSNDLFDRTRFYKQFQSEGVEIEGKTNLWADSFLVNQILNNGLSEQEDIFNQFLSALKSIQEVRRQAWTVLRYLKTPQENFFNDFAAIYDKSHTLSSPLRGSIKENFIRNYIITNHPVLEDIPKVQSICAQVFKLKNMFGEKEGGIEVHKLSEFENTLAVEILTNPHSFGNLTKLMFPVTTPDRIYQAIRITKIAKDEQDETKAMYNTGLLVLEAVKDSCENLRILFEKIGVSKALGIEYIQHMLFNCIYSLPGAYLLHDAGSDPRTVTESAQINLYYRLSKPIIKRYTVANVKGGLTIKDVLDSQNITASVIKKFSPDQQYNLIESVLTNKHFIGRLNYEKTIRYLLEIMNLKFESNIQIFRKTSRVTDELASPRMSVLEVCLRKIQIGDSRLINIFERVILEPLLLAYLTEGKYKLQPEKYLFAVSNYGSWISRKTIEKEEGVRQIIKLTAGFSLSLYFSRENIEGLELKDCIARAINLIMLNIKLLHPHQAGQFQQLTLTRAERLKQEFFKAAFTENYPEKKKEIIVKILENSIAALGIRHPTA